MVPTTPLVSTTPTTGVLLVNLGTPNSPSVADVRTYLRQFLMDGRVIDIPYLGRFALVNGIIAPFRSPKSAKAYKELWDPQTGSPLKHNGFEVERLLQEKLGPTYAVALAMRYQNPSIASVLDALLAKNIEQLVVIPMFPQYASASSGSVVEAVSAELAKRQIIPSVRYINKFYDNPGFINAFAQIAKPMLMAESYDRVLFSYHGLPQRQIKKGDANNVCVFGACCEQITPKNAYCYRAQCFATTRLLIEAIGLDPKMCITTFQSRLGRDPWLQPYTDKVIGTLTKEGIKRVAVLSPAFVSDCLETTIEIGEEYKELFEEQGGHHWQLIPSLNNSPAWIDTLAQLAQKN